MSFVYLVYFLMIRRPPRSTRTATLLPFHDALPICGGNRFQFNDDGSQVVDYDPGIYYGGSAIAIGGDGLAWREVSTAGTGVERYTGSANWPFDITTNVKTISAFPYGHQNATDPSCSPAIFLKIGRGHVLTPIPNAPSA